ncbi:hypothetical protein CEXT_429521 [Caerostris extrusa]|uniref:Uncharacterized protein n=1 Tax=Caerostris extrusa TaxID=172846 RepID=A0AAV4XLX9_CAEEX|nr:hypothetical protein CEXT_429521 [Caerostris extrusa]
MEDSQVSLICENAATLFGTVFHILEHLSKKEEDYPYSICCQQLRSATDISDDSRQIQTTHKKHYNTQTHYTCRYKESREMFRKKKCCAQHNAHSIP